MVIQQAFRDAIRPIRTNVLFPIRHLFQLRRWQAERRGAAIIMFHGIERDVIDPAVQSVHMSAAAFRTAIRVILERHEIVPIERIVTAVEQGEALPPHWAAITFDDGYENNLTVMRPVLREFGDLPAAVYVCPGCSRQRVRFWWTLIRVVLLTTTATSIGSPRFNRTYRLGGRLSRRVAAEDLIARIKRLPGDEQQTAADEVVANVPADFLGAQLARFGSDTLLTLDQIKTLANEPNITIGSHTVDHVILHDRQPESLIEREVSESRRQLESLLGRPVEHFAYPSGIFCDAARSALRRAGYRSAICTNPGEVGPGTDPLVLPRVGSSSNAHVLRRGLALAARQRFTDSFV